MPLYERIASTLVGTPLQEPAEWLRWFASLPQRLRHPELREIYREDWLVAEVVRRVVRPDTNCIDAGAHLGFILSRLVRAAPRGRHTAVEPIPYKAEWLRRKFPAVSVRQVALGETNGKAEFFLSSHSSAFSGLRPHGPGRTTRLEVACVRLDDLIPEDWAVGFAKIDVEGGELGVFRGAGRLLARCRPILLFECTRSGLDAFASTAHELYDHLCRERGYQIFLMKDWLAGGAPLELARFEASMEYPFLAFNYIAAPTQP